MLLKLVFLEAQSMLVHTFVIKSTVFSFCWKEWFNEASDIMFFELSISTYPVIAKAISYIFLDARLLERKDMQSEFRKLYKNKQCGDKNMEFLMNN